MEHRFNHWTVVGDLPPEPIHSNARILCRCVCNTTRYVRWSNLRRGLTKCCGCIRKPKTISTHGFSYHPLFKTWNGMMRRCYEPQEKCYYRYGGRGIKVCERWHDLAAFISDLGEKPEGMTIDRIDNDGDYCPENIRFVSHKENCRNRFYEKQIEFDGQRRTTAEWGEVTGLGRCCIKERLKRGWSIERTLTTPKLRQASSK